MKIFKFLFFFVTAISLSQLSAAPRLAKSRTGNATPTTKPTPKTVLRDFEFKGVKPGDNAQQHIDKWRPTNSKIPIQSNCDLLNIEHLYCSFSDEMVSGVPVMPSATFDKGTLWTIQGSSSVDRLEIIAEAFRIKYGAPKESEETTFSNGYGATWTYNTYVWEFLDGILLLRAEPGYANKTQLFAEFKFMSNAYLAEAEQRATKPQVDF